MEKVDRMWYDLKIPCLCSLKYLSSKVITIFRHSTIIYLLHWILDLLLKCKDVREGQLRLYLECYKIGSKFICVPDLRCPSTNLNEHERRSWKGKKFTKVKFSLGRREWQSREKQFHFHFISMMMGSREIGLLCCYESWNHPRTPQVEGR